MRKLARILLLKPVLWFSSKFSSKPVAKKIFKALSRLKQQLQKQPCKKGPLLQADASTCKIIVFSDQHKGAKDGADDFMLCEANYIGALEYYNAQGFCFISLGDEEELWENRWWLVREKNLASYAAEKKFANRDAFIKLYGNHDLSWNTDPFTTVEMEKLYGKKLRVYEGALLQVSLPNQQSPSKKQQLSVLLTHGHQGDAKSDGNWFSKFFVAHIWAPLQAYLKVNPNTPAYNATKKTLHNRIMYEWAAKQKNTVLITGHTHQPVFCSLTELERLYRKLLIAEKEKNNERIEEIKLKIRKAEPGFISVSADYLSLKPAYFNSGCCCFSDGDITGIEIAEGYIRLVKWEEQNNQPFRCVLEEMLLSDLTKELY
ncbi:MAG: metallophosphoesterase [Chitinophagaceae bacterium]